MKNLFNLITIIILCSASTLSAQSDNDIFERFPWLINNEIVDPLDCSGVTIEVYQQSIFNFLLVTDASGTATLYNQEGLFYCQNASNYDCVAAYGFDAPVETFMCGDDSGNSSCGDITGTILFAPCNNQLFFLVRTEDGRVLDPYIDQVPTYVPVEGQTINFNFTNAPFGTPCINAERAINLSCVEIIETPEVSANCGSNSGTIFFEECAGIQYYFIRTTDGVVLDAYQAPGVNFQPAEGQVVNFDFYDATFETPCSQADRAAIITCIELGTPNSSDPTVFEDFDFLQDVVDPADCAGTSIEVYEQGPFNFIFVNTGAESGQLYFEDGTFYCNTMANYDCVSLYNLGTPVRTWNCGDPGIVSTETRSAFAISKPAFTAYPNPTNGYVTIQLEVENDNAQHLFVTDALGRTILQKDIAPRATSTNVDISTYQKGLYYVVVQAGDQRVVKKIVKQ